MTWLRTLLAAVFGSMARDEHQAAKAAQPETHEKRLVIVPKPTRYYRESKGRTAAEAMPPQPATQRACATEDPLAPPAQEIAP